MLTDTKVRNLKPKNKLYRVADSYGLAIEVNPNGSKLWRHRFRYNKKATMMSLGSYPMVSLLDARQERDNNKQLLKEGINPARCRVASVGDSEPVDTSASGDSSIPNPRVEVFMLNESFADPNERDSKRTPTTANDATKEKK